MMGRSSTAIDAVLAKRKSIVRALREQPRSKRSIDDSLECSRSTIDRSISDLRDAGLVKYTDQRWELTAFGELAYRFRLRYLDYLDDVETASPLLEEIPDQKLISAAMLRGGTVHFATAPTPDLVMAEFVNYTSRGERVRVYTPAIVTGYLRSFYEGVTTNPSTKVEVVVAPDVFDRVTAAYPDLTQTIFEDVQIELLQAPIPSSFGLWIVDGDHAGLLVFTDSGIRGLLVNEDDAARAWAKDQYDMVCRSAKRIA